jgi:hypothetical protein
MSEAGDPSTTRCQTEACDPQRAERASSPNEDLQLILDHADDILANERYFYCYQCTAFLSVAYHGGGQLPLGVLILLWRQGEMLDTCTKCGGTVHIFGVGGSPLSGSHSWWGFCIQCGSRVRGHREDFGSLWRPVSKMLKDYKNEPVIQRGELPEWSWADPPTSGRAPDVVIKPRIEGVSLDTLLRELRENDARAGGNP